MPVLCMLVADVCVCRHMSSMCMCMRYVYVSYRMCMCVWYVYVILQKCVSWSMSYVHLANAPPKHVYVVCVCVCVCRTAAAVLPTKRYVYVAMCTVYVVYRIVYVPLLHRQLHLDSTLVFMCMCHVYTTVCVCVCTVCGQMIRRLRVQCQHCGERAMCMLSCGDSNMLYDS